MADRYWRFLTWLVGALLLHMAKLADRRSDVHELRHIGAQMDAGDTTDCKPGECPHWPAGEGSETLR